MVLIIAAFNLKAHQFQSSVMFLTQEFFNMACIALQFVILCYLIKMYRAVLQLGMNHKQALTEGRNRPSTCERVSVRYATEHDERVG